jgi:hypothetical protein
MVVTRWREGDQGGPAAQAVGAVVHKEVMVVVFIDGTSGRSSRPPERLALGVYRPGHARVLALSAQMPRGSLGTGKSLS